MPILYLTSKLLSEIDDPLSLGDDMRPSPLGDWYGHIFTMDRRKCILFINDPTHFVSLACWVKSHYRQLVPFFREMLTQTLRTHCFGEDEVAFILRQHEDIRVGRMQNRTMIGSLNNRIADAKNMIARRGGYDGCDWHEINLDLNQTPMKPIGYAFGLEQMRTLIEQEMK